MYPVSQVTGKSVLPLGHIGLKSMLDRSGINLQPANNEKVIYFVELFCKPLTDTAANGNIRTITVYDFSSSGIIQIDSTVVRASKTAICKSKSSSVGRFSSVSSLTSSPLSGKINVQSLIPIVPERTVVAVAGRALADL